MNTAKKQDFSRRISPVAGRRGQKHFQFHFSTGLR
jgi:hypothetical protein